MAVPGDSVALAILRTGETPAGGGTLCLTGDCGNCLAQVDGVAYIDRRMFAVVDRERGDWYLLREGRHHPVLMIQTAT